MTISFNTGTTTTQTAVAHTVHPTLTIPAGVLAADLMLVSISVFTFTPTSPDFTLTATSGHAWTPLGGGVQNSGASGGVNVLSKVWSRSATAGDPGDTLTFAFTGTQGSTDQFWWAIDIVSYTGAGAVDVVATPATGTSAGTAAITQPSVNTLSAGDWEVDILACAINSSGTISSPPSGKTMRENSNTAGIANGNADSNASVGGAGTSLGGGTFLASNSQFGWWVAWTLGISPGTPAPPAISPALRIPHPLWLQLLEVAAQRADWQQQGVPQPYRGTFRLMDGLSGRPGVSSSGTQPPAAGTSNGSAQVNGTSFYVTQGGMWFGGFWYYCAASGQSTSAAKFALWSDLSAGSGSGTVVPGTVVTSGTLTAGQWNFVPLAQAVQLAIGGVYTAAVGVAASAGYPGTTGQFGSGNPYQRGITSGPLAGFSDAAGLNPAPYSIGQGATVAGSDPSVTQPVSGSGNHDNYWLDVQVSSTPPAGYTGSYRLWPNMADADFNTAVDAAVSYVLATEVVLSQTCVVKAIWYYRPPGTTQFATSADIWRVRDQAHVATQPSPTWTVAGGGAAPAGGGQWVRCDMPGVTLPPGDYKFSVYNGNGSPDGWSGKSLGYWQACAAPGGRGTPDGTYKGSPAAPNGITTGPLYAPTTPLASAATDYATGNTEPGQSTFASGPPNQYPGTYVGASPSGIYTGPALFQNYWIDLEVILPPGAAVTITASRTAAASKAKTSGQSVIITASRTAAAGATRHRTASRPVTATISATAKVIRPRSVSRPATVTITAAAQLGGFHQGQATRAETATITARVTATHLRGASRPVTATVTAAATKHPKHLSGASRPATVTISASAVNEVHRRTALAAVQAAITAIAINPAPPPPPPPVVEQAGSWWQLIDIVRQDAEERAYWNNLPPRSCPNDGTPLVQAPPSASGVDLFCPHDGWQYPRDWSPGMP